VELIGVQPVIDIVALTLQSAFLNGQSTPISLMLISDPESAKTSTINSFSQLDFVAYYDEITAKQIIDSVIPQVKSGRCKYIVIPDLINCVEKNRATRDSFLALIKSAIDDTGIKRIATAYKSLEIAKDEQGIKFGIITAITSKNFKGIKHSMIKTGLMSRFIPFSYSYPIDKILTVFNLIAKVDKKTKKDRVPEIVTKPTDIHIDPKFSAQLFTLAREIGNQYEAYGIRAQVNLQRLAQANALLNNRKRVVQSDVDKIMSLSKWMNLRFEAV
jgi:hypothetical protein